MFTYCRREAVEELTAVTEEEGAGDAVCGVVEEGDEIVGTVESAGSEDGSALFGG
jgi:hypothetical protein